MLTDPHLIHTEIGKRLNSVRTADPTTQQRTRLGTALAKTSNGIIRMIEARGEGLIEALDTQLADRTACLTLASDLEGFLTQLHTNAEISTVEQRQRVLRLLVKDVLIGPDKITIRPPHPHPGTHH